MDAMRAAPALFLPLLLLLALPACDPPRPPGEGVSIPLSEADRRRALPLPPIAGAADRARPLVLIDAGHGGRDPGAVSPIGGVTEKAVTLALARAMRDRLAASGRVRVALTRADDRAIALEDRAALASRMGADLFVSVHADAAPRNHLARGATIYTLSEVASDAEAAALAARENGPARAGGTDLSEDAGVNRILIDLAQRESMNVAADFAATLHREGAALFPFQPDHHRFAALIALKAPDVPSILFESGYLTTAEDVAVRTSREGVERIADGMRRAVEAHFARRALAAPGGPAR